LQERLDILLWTLRLSSSSSPVCYGSDVTVIRLLTDFSLRCTRTV